MQSEKQGLRKVGTQKKREADMLTDGKACITPFKIQDSFKYIKHTHYKLFLHFFCSYFYIIVLNTTLLKYLFCVLLFKYFDLRNS